MGKVNLRQRPALPSLLIPPFPLGRAAYAVARPGPPTHTGNPTMNDNHHKQPESNRRADRATRDAAHRGRHAPRPLPPCPRHRQVDRHRRRRGLRLRRRRPPRLALGPSVGARRLRPPRPLSRCSHRCRSRHTISRCASGTHQTRCSAPHGAARARGYRRRSTPFTDRDTTPCCRSGWRPRPYRCVNRAMSRRFLRGLPPADAIPAVRRAHRMRLNRGRAEHLAVFSRTQHLVPRHRRFASLEDHAGHLRRACIVTFR